MLDLTKLKLTLNQILGSDRFILLSLDEKTIFENGKPTDRKQVVATVTTTESLFEKVAVKVDSIIGMSVSNEVLAERVKNMDFLYVEFKNDDVKIYREYASGQNRVTAKAKEMTLAEDSNIDLD